MGDAANADAWKSPAGLSAIAAGVATVAALVGVAVQAADNSQDQGGASGPGSQPPVVDWSFPEIATVAELVSTVEVVASASLPANEADHRFLEISSSSGSVAMTIPVRWGSQGISPLLAQDSDDVVGLVVLATPEVSRFYNEWNVPGMFVGITEQTEAVADVLESRTSFYEQSCVLAGENEVLSNNSTGTYRVWMS